MTTLPATYRKQAFVGGVLGAAAGLMLSSALVAVWLGPGWIWWMFFPPVLPAIVAYLGWKGAVLARQRGFQPLPYWKSVLLGMILWPCCVIGPMWLQASRNAEELRAAFDAHVPLPRGAVLVDERIVALSFNEGIPNHLLRTFRLENSLQTVLRFYRDELGKAGWSNGPTGYVEHAMCGTSNWFAHREICFAIGVYVPPSAPTDEFSIRLERSSCEWK